MTEIIKGGAGGDLEQEGRRVTLMIPKETLAILMAFAVIDGNEVDPDKPTTVTLGDIIRGATRDYAKRRLDDPDFGKEWDRAMGRSTAMLPVLNLDELPSRATSKPPDRRDPLEIPLLTDM